jgi:serine/threonine protein kinase
MSRSTVLSILRQLLQTLMYLEKRKIMHRDIKLENVMIDDVATAASGSL